MKNNNLFKKIIYILLIIFFIYVAITFILKDFKAGKIQYNNLIILMNFIFFGGIGFLLGLDNLITQLKNKGKWMIDKKKLIILGLPSLILSSPNLLFSLISPSIPFIYCISFIANVVLGYTFVSSFYKDNLKIFFKNDRNIK